MASSAAPSRYMSGELNTLSIRCSALQVALSLLLLIGLPRDHCNGAHRNSNSRPLSGIDLAQVWSNTRPCEYAHKPEHDENNKDQAEHTAQP